MKKLLFFLGVALLFTIEILRVYFIMPFPGSQKSDTIGTAYWISGNIAWVRIVAIALMLPGLIHLFRHSKKWKKIVAALVLLFYGFVFFKFNYRFQADKMFHQPVSKTFAVAADTGNKVEKLVIGVAINGEAKAYPIQVIGYHHQVRDTVGNTPVMITYCTVCRTGRVFSPLVNGRPETFRLVGMDHFNAMFEDATTKSWWRQATGEAIAGSLKGQRLAEIPSSQLTLASWLRQYPNSKIMRPDTLFKEDYDDLADFDKGKIKSSLEKRDSGSWKFKSWVVGVTHGKSARAYDWNMLVNRQLLQDSLPGLPLVIALETDTASFHVYNRLVNGQALQFTKQTGVDSLYDHNTHSSWSLLGLCTSGPLQGTQLQTVQAYQEFWHSWQQFHPTTTKFE